jgi:hypothetical protein
MTSGYDINPTREELLSLAPLVDACEPKHLESTEDFRCSITLAILSIVELLWFGSPFSRCS